MSRILVATLGLLVGVGCAGSTSFELCEPNVCACELDECETLELGPGQSNEIVATFVAEGSHKGTYIFSTTTDDGLTASASPGSADVNGDLEVTLSLELDASAEMGDTYYVSLEGQHEKKDLGASVGFFIEVPGR